MSEPTTAELRKEWEDDAGGGFDWTEEDVEGLHNKFGILLKRLEEAEAKANETENALMLSVEETRKAEVTLQAVAELPDNWIDVFNDLVDDGAANPHFVADCAAELKAALEAK